MVMDFISGGELFSLLRKSQVRLPFFTVEGRTLTNAQRFPDPVAKFFAAEVALALDYLHSLDIIYRCAFSPSPACLCLAPVQRSEAREHPSRCRRAYPLDRLWLRSLLSRYYLDALWHARLPRAGDRAE